MGKYLADVIQRIGPLRVAGDFGNLPRRQITVDVFNQLLAFFTQLLDFS